MASRGVELQTSEPIARFLTTELTGQTHSHPVYYVTILTVDRSQSWTCKHLKYRVAARCRCVRKCIGLHTDIYRWSKKPCTFAFWIWLSVLRNLETKSNYDVCLLWRHYDFIPWAKSQRGPYSHHPVALYALHNRVFNFVFIRLFSSTLW